MRGIANGQLRLGRGAGAEISAGNKTCHAHVIEDVELPIDHGNCDVAQLVSDVSRNHSGRNDHNRFAVRIGGFNRRVIGAAGSFHRHGIPEILQARPGRRVTGIQSRRADDEQGISRLCRPQDKLRLIARGLS